MDLKTYNNISNIFANTQSLEQNLKPYKHLSTYKGTSNLLKTLASKSIRYIPKLREAGSFEIGCVADTTSDVTTLDALAASAQAIVPVTDTSIFNIDDWVVIDPENTGAGPEFGQVRSVNLGVSITLSANLGVTHNSGVNIYKCSQYSEISSQDSEHYRIPGIVEAIIVAANLSSEGWYLEIEEKA